MPCIVKSGFHVLYYCCLVVTDRLNWRQFDECQNASKNFNKQLFFSNPAGGLGTIICQLHIDIVFRSISIYRHKLRTNSDTIRDYVCVYYIPILGLCLYYIPRYQQVAYLKNSRLGYDAVYSGINTAVHLEGKMEAVSSFKNFSHVTWRHIQKTYWPIAQLHLSTSPTVFHTCDSLD